MRGDADITVLIADDHAGFREGLATVLAQCGFAVLGTAADGAEAVALAERLLPRVVLMDVSMPVINGLEATKQIRSRLPGVSVVGLSMHRQDTMGRLMLDNGAASFLNKAASVEEICDAIRAADHATAPRV